MIVSCHLVAGGGERNSATSTDRCLGGAESWRVNTRAITPSLRVRLVTDERVTDHVQLRTPGELWHVEPEAPGQPVDVVQQQAKVLCRRASVQ